MFCANCGNKIDDKSKFCPNCGTKIFSYKENSLKTVENNDPIENQTVLSVKGDSPLAEDLNEVSPEIKQDKKETSKVVEIEPEQITQETSGAIEIEPEQTTQETSGAIEIEPEQTTQETSGVIEIEPEQTTQETSGVVDATPTKDPKTSFETVNTGNMTIQKNNENIVSGEIPYVPDVPPTSSTNTAKFGKNKSGGQTPPPRKSGPSDKTLKIIAIVLIVVVLAGGAYLFFGPKDDTKPSSTAVSSNKEDKKEDASDKKDENKDPKPDEKNNNANEIKNKIKDALSMGNKNKDKEKDNPENENKDNEDSKSKDSMKDKIKDKLNSGLKNKDKENSDSDSEKNNESDKKVLEEKDFKGVWFVEGYKYNLEDDNFIDLGTNNSEFIIIEKDNIVHDVELDEYTNVTYNATLYFEKNKDSISYDFNNPDYSIKNMSITRINSDTLGLKITNLDGTTYWGVLVNTGEDIYTTLDDINNIVTNQFSGTWLATRFQGYYEGEFYDDPASESDPKLYFIIDGPTKTIYYAQVDQNTEEILGSESAPYEIENAAMIVYTEAENTNNYILIEFVDGELVAEEFIEGERSEEWIIFSASDDNIAELLGIY